jgi:hypothetical protein
MKHSGYEYGFQQVLDTDGEKRFRWIIYPPMQEGPKVIGQETYATSEEANKACRAEIDLGKGAATGHGVGNG